MTFCCRFCTWALSRISKPRHEHSEEQQQQQQDQQRHPKIRTTNRAAPPPPVPHRTQLAPLPALTAWRPAMSGGAFEMVDLGCQYSNPNYQVI